VHTTASYHPPFPVVLFPFKSTPRRIAFFEVPQPFLITCRSLSPFSELGTVHFSLNYSGCFSVFPDLWDFGPPLVAHSPISADTSSPLLGALFVREVSSWISFFSSPSCGLFSFSSNLMLLIAGSGCFLRGNDVSFFPKRNPGFALDGGSSFYAFREKGSRLS